MIFHFEQNDGCLVGWVLPDNPSALPRIKIYSSDGLIIEVEANTLRTDLRDRGMHDTGMAGFFIDDKVYPNLSGVVDQIEVRESGTNTLVYRKYLPTLHVKQKLVRFDLRAMPDPELEGLFAKHFALYYGTAQRYPQDTFFGIANNPTAESLYLSGRPNLQQYEQLLREREFKFIALIRNPYEEMAERLLFARYASTPGVPAFVADHMFGLTPLMDMAKAVKFDDTESIRVAFAAMTEEQKKVLTNPLVRTLACLPNELPKNGHVEIALSKLSRMELVGLRNRFGEFKSMLHEVLGIDVLGQYNFSTLPWVDRVVASLSQIKQARALITLDLDLYSFIEEAITEAIGPVGLAS